MLFWDFAAFQSMMALLGEGVSVQSYKRIFRPMLFKRVIQGQKSRKVLRVSNERCPHYMRSVSIVWQAQPDHQRQHAFGGVHHPGGIWIGRVGHVTAKLAF